MPTRRRFGTTPFWGSLLAVLAAAQAASGQGLIIDRRPSVPIPRSFEIKEVRIDAQVRDQVAEVQIAQTFHNPGSIQLEAEYLFPLPDDGVVQNFVLLVDGRELPGKLLTREEARRIYEEIVRTKRDPALLEYMGRGLFRTSVFPIPPGADRKVTMRYTQLCKRDRDVVEFAYPLATQKFTARPIQRLTIEVLIRSQESIKSIYSPSGEVTIDRVGDHEARIRLDRRDLIPAADFRVVYTLAEGALGASVLSYQPDDGDDGYFLLLASPKIEQTAVAPRPKTVVFVLDRSGSMAGKKIEQARGALRTVLNQLRDDDLFNIVVFDDRVETFRPELQRSTPQSRDDAQRFVDNIREGGSTNIDAALREALGMIPDRSRPSYILFLTDGLPTTGETQELRIADNCRAANTSRARIFCFGLGFDVNARLLDRISGAHGGTTEYVKPDEDIEAKVARFAARLTAPVLTDLKIELVGVDVNRTFPRQLPDLFEGGQLVWVGRYRQPGRTTVRISGDAGGQQKTFEFSAELADRRRGESHQFVERLWALRRIGDLIDQIDLGGPNRELIDELVRLSTRHGILTPYTSFLADERVPLHTAAAHADRARESLRALESVSGDFGVAQRELKQAYNQANNLDFQLQDGSSQFAPSSATGLGGYGGLGGMGSGGMVGRGATLRQSRNASAPAGTPAGSNLAVPPATPRDAPGAQPPATPAPPPIRHLGAKTFYLRDGRWIDSTLTPEDETHAKLIRQFSPEFFELARSQTAEENQYLSFAEPVLVKLGGTVYRIEPDPAP